MSKKDFSQDAFDTFEIEARKPPNAVSNAKPTKDTPETQKGLKTAENGTKKAKKPRTAGKGEKESFEHHSYYVTEKQHRALKIRAATSKDPNEKDISSIVRLALERYLVDTLNEMK